MGSDSTSAPVAEGRQRRGSERSKGSTTRQLVELSNSPLDLYLHDDDFHAKNFIFSAGFICDVGKLVDLGWINLLKEVNISVALDRH